MRIATLYNFAASRGWTYAGGGQKPVGVQLIQFAIVSLLGLLLNDLIVMMLSAPLHNLLAQAAWSYIPTKILATGAVAVWTYVTKRLWIFTDRPTAMSVAQ